MKALRWAVFVLGYLFIVVWAACGQTISPSAMEFKGPRAKGTLLIKNEGAGTLQVKVQPQGFDWTEGKPHLAELPKGFQWESKQRTLILGPGQVKYVDFTARCEAMPCHFYMTSVFTTPKPKDGDIGLTTAMWLPCAVYLCEKQKACRMRTLKEAGAIK